jgi:hypothetical protein
MGGTRAEPEPGDEVLLGGEGFGVGSDLGQDDAGSPGADAVNPRQVEAGETPKVGSQGLLSASPDGALLGAVGVGRSGLLSSVRRLQRLDLGEQSLVVGGDELFYGVIKSQRRRQIEDVFLSPGAGEALGDLRLGFMAAPVAAGSQTSRVALAGHDGTDDGHARIAREIGNGSVDLHVHLVEGLLHPLDAAGSLVDKVGRLPLQGPQPDDGVTWAKGAAEQTAAVQGLEPLAVEEVGLSARDVVQLPGVDEHGLDAA